MMRRLPSIILAAFLATPAHPRELVFPITPEPTAQNTRPAASAKIATGSWKDGTLPGVTARGRATLRAWKLPDTDLTTLQILDTLREGLVRDGFEILFECDTLDCGGFDFRYNIPHIPEPDMHVDLGDFRYLAARRRIDDQKRGETPPGEEHEYLALLVSRSPRDGFVQMLHVVPDEDAANGADASAVEAGPVAGGTEPVDVSDLARKLEAEGRIVLEDLQFATGSAALRDEDFASLRALAKYLKENPGRRIILVGHTDAEGSLGGNIALSKKRATAVMQRLREKYGVSPGQISAEGIGYLAPRASNLSEEKRALNRRVEAILTSAE